MSETNHEPAAKAKGADPYIEEQVLQDLAEVITPEGAQLLLDEAAQRVTIAKICSPSAGHLPNSLNADALNRQRSVNAAKYVRDLLQSDPDDLSPT